MCLILHPEGPLLSGHDRSRDDLATDCPDEAGQFAGDRSDNDGLELAPAQQRPVTRIETGLCLPGDLAHRLRRRRHLVLLLASDPRRVAVTPRAFHQCAARPPVAGLGDWPTPDRLAGRMLR